jgi:cholesterol oxidase
MQVEEHFDAIVIGSGFGGAVMTCRLAEAGMRVCLLERGRAYPPGAFPRNPRAMQHNFWDPKAKLFGLFNIWSFRGLDAVVSSGLGGGSLIYANVLLRKHPETFVRGDPNDPDAEDWPIDYADLVPHYRAVEEVLKPRRYPFEQLPYSRTAKTIALQKAQELEGYKWQAAPLGITFAGDNGVDPNFDAPLPNDPHNYHGAETERFACSLCGECDLGCNHGSKNTLDHTFLSMANRHPNTTIRTLCEVQEFAPHPRGYMVTYTRYPLPTGEEGSPPTTRTITAEQLVLAAGTLGSNYLLLKNRAAFPELSRRVGYRFCTNGDMIMFLTMPDAAPQPVSGIDAFQGPVITSTARLSRSTRDGWQREIHLQDAGAPQFAYWMLFVPDLMRAMWVERRHFWRLVWLQMRGRPDHDLGAEVAALFRHPRFSEGLLPLLAMGQDTPDGRVRLLGRRRPKLNLDWRMKRSSRFFEQASAAGEELAAAVGATFHDSLHRRLKRSITVHPLGGCAMARSPEQGVVDAWGEVFHYPGFFIADGSVMPGPVGPNPALTIAAVAHRFADRVIANHRKGRLKPMLGRTVKFDRQPPALPTQIRFAECMRGFVMQGAQPFAQAYRAGRAAGTELEMRLKVRIPDLAAFLANPEHGAVVSGKVSIPSLAALLNEREPDAELDTELRVERGVLNLWVDCGSPAEKEMRYCLFLRDSERRAFTLYGFKSAPNGMPLADTTTLFTQLWAGHHAPPCAPADVLASGILHISAGEIVGLLASLRAKAPTRGQAWRGLARFAGFYLRKLWQAYAHLPQRRATRQKLATRRSESRN